MVGTSQVPLRAITVAACSSRAYPCSTERPPRFENVIAGPEPPQCAATGTPRCVATSMTAASSAAVN